MKSKVTPCAVFLLAFIFLFQSRSFADEQPVRGFWIWGATLTSSNIQTIVDKLADNYVNEVYLLVKGTSGTKTNAINLTNFITKAHAKSIKVHFWYCVFQDDAYLRSNPNAHVYHCPNPSARGGDVNPYPNTDSSINPFFPGYKEYVLNNIGYFLNHFDCDGIHLDYIRYGHLVYSFDPYSLEKAASLGCNTTRLLGFFNTPGNYTIYASGSGFINLYANRDPDVVTWVNMRKNIIFDYITAIRDTMESVKPGIKLTAAFMPEGIYDPNLADVHYAQNYALHSTLLDMISPMSYFKSYGKSTSWLKTIAISAINRVDSRCKIVAGLQDFAGADGVAVTPTEMDEQIAYALDGGSYGVLIFKYDSSIDNDSWVVIQSKFKSLSLASAIDVYSDYLLDQNLPNPFNSITEITFQVTKPCLVSLNVYDALGRQVAPLINKDMAQGTYKVSFNGNNLQSGVYFYRLDMAGLSSVKKMILTK